MRTLLVSLELCFPAKVTHLLCDLIRFKHNFLLPDYNNARVLDFQDVSNYVSNAVSIMDTARMPWHDVSFKVVHI
jgi:phospholipase D1/2